MKKIMFTSFLLASGVLMSAPAFAKAQPKPMSCPFQDSFTIQAPGGSMIQSLRTDGNVSAQEQNSYQFTVGCADNNNGSDGNIYLTVGNGQNQCQLTVVDGPYEMNPLITSSSCTGGLQFTGMDHPFGSYAYTLKFA